MDLKTIGKVKHNGKWYDPDATIKKVTKEEGERLIKMGVAEEIEAEQKDKDPGGQKNNEKENK